MREQFGEIETAIGPRPRLDTDQIAAEFILKFSGTTNGRLATQGFKTLTEKVGASGDMTEMSRGHADYQITLADVQQAPKTVVTSPNGPAVNTEDGATPRLAKT